MPYLGMKLRHWQNFQKWHICSLLPLFIPPPSPVSLFSPCGQTFRDTGRFSELSYLGTKGFWNTGLFSKLPYMKLGNWQKSQKLSCAFYPRKSNEIELILVLWVAVSEILADFPNFHIWTWNLVIGKGSKSCPYYLVLPQGIEIERMFYGQRLPIFHFNWAN